MEVWSILRAQSYGKAARVIAARREIAYHPGRHQRRRRPSMISSLARSLILALAVVMPAAAQDWPSKPVRFIVPFPPGGSVDPLARLLGARLTDPLKTQFI